MGRHRNHCRFRNRQRRSASGQVASELGSLGIRTSSVTMPSCPVLATLNSHSLNIFFPCGARRGRPIVRAAQSCRRQSARQSRCRWHRSQGAHATVHRVRKHSVLRPLHLPGPKRPRQQPAVVVYDLLLLLTAQARTQAAHCLSVAVTAHSATAIRSS